MVQNECRLKLYRPGVRHQLHQVGPLQDMNPSCRNNQMNIVGLCKIRISKEKWRQFLLN